MEYSDQEQLDAIKKWWKDNGNAVIVGVALGVSVLFGWRFYDNYQNTQRITASAMYEQVLVHLRQEQAEEARFVLNNLLSDYGSTTYAALAALSIAQQDVKEEALDKAHGRLQWVLDNADMPELQHVARVRKARLYLNDEQLDAAEQLLAGVAEVGTFSGSYGEIRGDIALAKQDIETAQTAYETALESEHLSNEHRQFIQMKLDNLGVAGEQQVVAPAPVLPVVEDTATPATVEQSSLELPVPPAAEQLTPADALASVTTVEPVTQLELLEKKSLALATPSTITTDNTVDIVAEAAASVAAMTVEPMVNIVDMVAETATPSTVEAAEPMADSNSVPVELPAVTPEMATPTTIRIEPVTTLAIEAIIAQTVATPTTLAVDADLSVLTDTATPTTP